jgi:hypothetical protein
MAITEATVRRAEPLRQYGKRGRRFRGGRVAAVVRAFTGGHLHQGVPVKASTLRGAATMVGSNVAYIQAAEIVLQAQDPVLMAKVLRGQVPLLEAALQVKGRVRLTSAYTNASPTDRVEFARAVGPENLFDNAVVPAATPTTTSTF